MTIEREAIAGVVLAGGLSRRMGGPDKSLMDLGGTSLVERAAAHLGKQVGPVGINFPRNYG